jgi:hypothetical protein
LRLENSFAKIMKLEIETSTIDKRDKSCQKFIKFSLGGVD